MSVGRPYFDRMAVPLGAALLLLMGVGPALPWGRASAAQMKKALLPPLLGAGVLLGLGVAWGVRNPWTLAVLAFGGFTAHVTFREGLLPWRQRMRGGEGVVEAGVEGLLRRGNRRFGGYLVHAGMVVVFISIAVSSTMGQSQEMVLGVGETQSIGRYALTFLRTEQVNEPHRSSQVAVIGIKRDGEDVGTLEPRMNQYESQREPIGTPAVRSTLREDLYLSILSLDPSGQRLALHAIVNPMVGWLWGAVLFMAGGGVLALLPLRRAEPAPAPLGAPALVGGRG
jgi:cytochrome c-type biogenesis protein CcmF